MIELKAVYRQPSPNCEVNRNKVADRIYKAGKKREGEKNWTKQSPMQNPQSSHERWAKVENTTSPTSVTDFNTQVDLCLRNAQSAEKHCLDETVTVRVQNKYMKPGCSSAWVSQNIRPTPEHRLPDKWFFSTKGVYKSSFEGSWLLSLVWNGPEVEFWDGETPPASFCAGEFQKPNFCLESFSLQSQ